MPGIYIHIPFCKQACHYCDFHFSTSQKMVVPMLRAMQKEITGRLQESANEETATVYFGGGTPSLVPPDELARMLGLLRENYRVQEDAEITLEANPDDLNDVYLRRLKEIGINRLSIGIQSFREQDLALMNRVHTAGEALDCVKRAQAAGFGNITIDLIYGIPGLENADWKKNLETAFGLQVPHISSYCLTVEPRTALAHFVQTGKVKPVDEQLASQQFRILMQRMNENGFAHYEISNFAKPGFLSRHNSSYWSGEKYIGIGPSAHSFDGKKRRWNLANNAQYAAKIQSGETYWEEETLTPAQRYNEYVMISLRTSRGCDLQQIEKNFGAEKRDYLLGEAAPYLLSGDLLREENILRLSEQGKLLADRIASDLFIV
ncbi:MAG: putative oxygen-independent coproporphyrinogen III oxidase [Bacteroidetes bacterium]|nr:MAG: putative oxygen-independent coproporphyrinogen III oxidase [Bacteroidota bacterium]